MLQYFVIAQWIIVLDVVETLFEFVQCIVNFRPNGLTFFAFIQRGVVAILSDLMVPINNYGAVN